MMPGGEILPIAADIARPLRRMIGVDQKPPG
jgi:hypothetical protein